MLIQKLLAHLVTLGRPFALPAAVCGVILGGLIAKAPPFTLFLAVMTGVLLMFACHSWNSFQDWVIGFDKGEPKERSKKKVYTSGQSLLALGIVSQNEVLANSIGWLILSLAFAIPLSLMTTMWVWLPWGLVALCAPWYSWGKLHFNCELALGLGFGSFAAMLGACAVPNPPLWTAFLAGLPLTLMWGFVAETVDQYDDWEVNWNKGLRNMGALVGAHGLSISHFFGYLIAITYLAQVALVMGGILSPLSMLSLIAFLPLTYGMLFLEKNFQVGVLIALGGIFLHMILLVIGQGMS